MIASLPNQQLPAEDIHPFRFNSVIYNGYDFTSDGIGNHLALLDELVFGDVPSHCKSLLEIPHHHRGGHQYGKVVSGLHLKEPNRFKNCLFLDIARETWSPVGIERQIRKTIEHKRAFNAVTAIYLMWESDRLWDVYLDLVRVYDFCIVTSTVLHEYLREQGIHFVNVRHPYKYCCEFESQTPEAENRSIVRFGVTAGLWKRKNVALLAETFARGMGNDPRCSLHIHTRFDPEDRDYRPEFDRIQKVCREHSNVELLARDLTRDEYLQWMRGLDVYCCVSSGEGYSVTPREALHLGKPVILHAAHVHNEIIDLPGVIPVKCAGRQPASANTSLQDFDIGMNWRLDVESLERAITKCIHELPQICDELMERRHEIISRHSIEDIRHDWIAALNAQYDRYIDTVRLDLPAFLSNGDASDCEDLPIRFNLGTTDFKQRTGTLVRGCVYCLRGNNRPGHCLYGPDYLVTKTERLKVNFRIDFLKMTAYGGARVALDVYDNASEVIIAFREIHYASIKGIENQFMLEFDAVAGQSLEFRVYWFANCDICVTGVRLSN